MENPLKIQAQLNELNRQSTPDGQPVVNEWIAFQGYSALTYAQLEASSPLPRFNPTMGIVVKTFLNTRTGEIKTFNAYMFEN
ncbi:MAG: hypothetical protein KGI50_04380 [Patescibacteria group bacterium]|nr:hypothetical protein [Patescibacteria group bacterium]MDE2438477.1 hypothetical protein [Patescibacteria group bacterium]